MVLVAGFTLSADRCVLIPHEEKTNQSDDEWFSCYDQCSSRYDRCIAAGNTQSACALDKLQCEAACKPPE